MEPGTTLRINTFASLAHRRAKQLDMEKLFVSSIYFSLNSILRRSPSLTFEEAYRTRFKVSNSALPIQSLILDHSDN